MSLTYWPVAYEVPLTLAYASMCLMGLFRDGVFLFSAGGADRCVNMWKVTTSALDAAEAIGGGGLSPFLRLLEGGEDGPLHQELRDYFTYTQLRMQVRALHGNGWIEL